MSSVNQSLESTMVRQPGILRRVDAVASLRALQINSVETPLAPEETFDSSSAALNQRNRGTDGAHLSPNPRQVADSVHPNNPEHPFTEVVPLNNRYASIVGNLLITPDPLSSFEDQKNHRRPIKKSKFSARSWVLTRVQKILSSRIRLHHRHVRRPQISGPYDFAWYETGSSQTPNPAPVCAELVPTSSKERSAHGNSPTQARSAAICAALSSHPVQSSPSQIASQPPNPVITLTAPGQAMSIAIDSAPVWNQVQKRPSIHPAEIERDIISDKLHIVRLKRVRERQLLDTTIAELENQVNDLRTDITSQKALADASQARRDILEFEVANLRNSNQKLEADALSHASKADALATELHQLHLVQNIHIKTTNRVVDLEREVFNLRRELANAAVEIGVERRRADTVTVLYDGLNKEYQTLVNDHQHMQSQFSNLQREFEALQGNDAGRNIKPSKVVDLDIVSLSEVATHAKTSTPEFDVNTGNNVYELPASPSNEVLRASPNSLQTSSLKITPVSRRQDLDVERFTNVDENIVSPCEPAIELKQSFPSPDGNKHNNVYELQAVSSNEVYQPSPIELPTTLPHISPVSSLKIDGIIPIDTEAPEPKSLGILIHTFLLDADDDEDKNSDSENEALTAGGPMTLFRFGSRRVQAIPAVQRRRISQMDRVDENSRDDAFFLRLATWEWDSVPNLDLVDFTNS